MTEHGGRKDYSYGWEKLSQAVATIATSQGSLQERLQSAYMPALSAVRPVNVPDEQLETLAEIKERLTSTPAKGSEGGLAASAAALSDQDAVELISKIVYLYGYVSMAMGARAPDREARSGS
jgi:hypothetical protein